MRSHLHLPLSRDQPGDQDEIRIDWRRRPGRGRFRNPRTGASRHRGPRLLCAVLPERKLPKSGSGQSLHQWRLLAERLAERQRVRATSSTTSPQDAGSIKAKRLSSRFQPNSTLHRNGSAQRRSAHGLRSARGTSDMIVAQETCGAAGIGHGRARRDSGSSARQQCCR